MKTTNLGLADITAPLTPVEFLAAYSDQRPAVFSQSNDLPPFPVELADLEAWAQVVDLSPGKDILVCREGKLLNPVFIQSLVTKHPDDWLSLALEKSWTIVFNGIERVLSAPQALAASLARDLGVPIGINAYYTPKGGVGFARHADTHDVLVWQLDGCKEWRIFSADDNPPLLDIETLVEPGTALYIPTGVEHSAKSSPNTPSLHLTIGFPSRSRLIKRSIKRTLGSWLDSDAGLQALSPLINLSPSGRTKLVTKNELIQLLGQFAEWAEKELPGGIPQKHNSNPTNDNIAQIGKALRKLPTAKHLSRIKPLELSTPSIISTTGKCIPFRPQFEPILAALTKNETLSIEEIRGLHPQADAMIRTLVGTGLVQPND